MSSDSDAPSPSQPPSHASPQPWPDTDWRSTPDTPPPGSDWFRRFILDYNPFFLLSALCMLLGSLLLTNSLSWSPVRLERVLLLTLTVNVYELILVGLGLFLVVRRNARRDAGILLILESFFLVDVAFLNAELFAIDKWVGLWANVALLILAVVKLSVICRVLRVPLASPLVACLVGEVVALYALPGALKFYAGKGTLPPLVMFIVWWAIALAFAMIFHAAKRQRLLQPVPAPALPWFVPFSAILAGVSLLAHAGTQQWVYDLGYYGAHLAPMLALAAFVLTHERSLVPPGLAFAAAALVASAHGRVTLNVDLFGHAVTPTQWTVVALYVGLGWTLARRFFAWLLAGGVGVAGVVVFGPAPATVGEGLKIWIGRVIDTIRAIYDTLRPRTQTHWGILSIGLSFLFLLVGAVISLLRSRDSDDAEAAA